MKLGTLEEVGGVGNHGSATEFEMKPKESLIQWSFYI